MDKTKLAGWNPKELAILRGCLRVRYLNMARADPDQDWQEAARLQAAIKALGDAR